MKLDYPATGRNRDAILAVLTEVLPRRGTVLEIASGSGQHAVYFAAAFPQVTWHPTDPESRALGSIAAWREESGLDNLAEPAHLDVLQEPWPVARADAVVCCNMIHIAPWACAEALIAGAGRRLSAGGVLVLYGPFKIGGAQTSPSNEAFDQSLRSRDPRWGVRDLEAVVALAEAAGLTLERTVSMPANNLSVVLRAG